MNELHHLAAFAAELRFDTLPDEVVARARWVLRDTIGVIIGGMSAPEVRALADEAATRQPGAASLLGHGGRVDPAWAALVHGTAGTTLEMDEGHAFARGHAAIHAVPPALALAQAAGASGQTLLAALVAGYEVAARAGIATRLRPPVHPFGAWGVLGAAAIGAWFRQSRAEAMAGTLELAASYAITPSFASAYQGATVRNTYAGVVNRLGLLAADLYRLGFRGERGGLQTTFGQILGATFDATALVDGLGERYEMMGGYFKPYSGCRYTHAAIDAVLALRAEEAVPLAALSAVEVATYDIAAHLTVAAPETPLAGRFSLPYVVAATLVEGSAGPEIFAPEKLVDTRIRELAARVRVRERADFTAMTPAQRPAQVVLHFKDGRRRAKTVTVTKGDPAQPMSPAELGQKFESLTAPTLGLEWARRAWSLLGRLDELPELTALTETLSAAAGHSRSKEVNQEET